MFIFHFISSSHCPPPFSIPLPLSSRLSSIPRARSLRTHWTGFFWLPSNSQTCSRRPTSHSDSDLLGVKGEVPLHGLFRVKQERQTSDRRGCVCKEGGLVIEKRREGVNYWDVHSFGLPGSGVQKKRVAGCSVYYPRAIWVGKLSGCGGIRLCVCTCTPLCVRVS